MKCKDSKQNEGGHFTLSFKFATGLIGKRETDRQTDIFFFIQYFSLMYKVGLTGSSTRQTTVSISFLTMPWCLQSVVEQGLDLAPQLTILVVDGGHIDEQLVLEQHVDVSSLQAIPAALRAAGRLVELRRQVIQHGALVPPPWLQLNGEADKIAGETCNLHLVGEDSRWRD